MSMSTEPSVNARIAALMHSPMFLGFSADELQRVCACLGVEVRPFERGDVLVREQDPLTSVGVVASGSVHSTRLLPDGHRDLVSIVSVGEVFGEEILGGREGLSACTVTGASPGVVLSVGMQRIVRASGPLCELRSRVVENLFHLLAEKNVALQQRLELLAHRSLRERILLYLDEQRRAHHPATRFAIDLSREQLAEYLRADRAALSRELMRMKRDGLIDVERNVFQLLDVRSLAA